MSTLELTERKTLDCPDWCTINHANPLCQQEEKAEGIRAHCVFLLNRNNVWVSVCRDDAIATGERSPLTVDAGAELVDMNSEQAIEFAQAVMRALAMTQEAA